MSEWYEELPDELKNDKSIQKFPSVDKLAKSYVELERLLGKAMFLPEEDKPEEWEKVYNRLGKPKDIQEYEEPSDVSLDDSMRTLFREVAHKSNLTKSQYKAFVKMLTEKQRSAVSEGLNKTKAELGQDFDVVEKTLDKIAPEVKSALYSSGLVANQAFMKRFAEMVKQFHEDEPVESPTKPQRNEHPYAWMEKYFNGG